MEWALAIVALALLAVAAALRHARDPVTPAMVRHRRPAGPKVLDGIELASSSDGTVRALAGEAVVVASDTLTFVRRVLELRAEVQLTEMLIDRSYGGSPVAQ